jgi:hypothetical protein
VTTFATEWRRFGLHRCGATIASGLAFSWTERASARLCRAFSEANQISKRGSFYLALFVHLVELFRRSCWISLSVIECAAIDFLPSLASF